jgi:nucleoside-diphosphate-sugar epimerase
MEVLVTGATGLIGTAVADRLLADGHEVHALCRRERACRALACRGLRPLPGDLGQLADWTGRLAEVDAVVHAAATFDAAMAATDAAFVDALLDQGRDRSRTRAALRVVYTGGIWLYGDRPGSVIREGDSFDPPAEFDFMLAARARLFEASDLSACVVHPGLVWRGEAGALAAFVDAARDGRAPEMIGSGAGHWSLVHADDLAGLYARALTAGQAGADYHGVCDPGVTVGAVAGAIAAHYAAPQPRRLSVSRAMEVHGAAARLYAYDQTMAADWTQRALDWSPSRRVADAFPPGPGAPPATLR